MKKNSCLMLSVCIFLTGNLQGQESEDLIRTGNQYYRNQQYDKAETAFRQVLDKDPGNDKAAFNLANTLVKQDKKTAALAAFTELAAKMKDNQQRAAALYNKGVLLQQSAQLDAAIEAWKAALRLNPADQQARENLQKALRERSKKNPPKKQQQKESPKKPKPRPQPDMSQKEAEQRLKLLEQKEKELNQRIQREKSKTGSGQSKDW